MLRPSLERGLPLGEELPALVDGRHAADRPLHVVQQSVGDVRRDAVAREPRHHRSAES